VVQISDSPKAVERKREILQAASRVFRRQGLHATRMRDIAEELGVAVGNLYYYFAGKQDLLAFCQEDALTGLIELAESVRAGSEPADVKLYRLVVGHVVLLNEATPGSLAHLEVEALEGRWRRLIQERRDRYERAVRELVEEGTAAGVFRTADAPVAARAILGALNWTVKWFRPDGGKNARAIGEEMAEVLVRGLLLPGAASACPDTGRPA
jgi:AcrR family transcriptional regulator